MSALEFGHFAKCEKNPLLEADHYPQVVRWTQASGTTGEKGEVPSLAKEGWPRHQVNGPVPLEARPGWFVQLPIIGGLNQPFFLVSPYRAHIRSAHARLRPLRWLRNIFLMGAATPPCPRSIQSCPAGQRQNTQETAPSKTKDLSAQFL